ncbi:MAG: glycine zipper 2TM domain-containing protein [Candidatus Thioglobus sp.]|nr:MAG: glycine zipper 2TM domain-containing protein [Candidatus Thioglobus sp.]KAA0446387.1 MAG: glycine zipper 2TM domain-containing protein [Candidatus Thioglobus sp.]
MKQLTKIKIAFLLLCLPLVAFAGSYTDSAKVLSVKDIFREHTIRTPYQDCYTQQVRQNSRGDGSATNELFGSLIGGAIGNRFGKGDGKKAMTVAGALLGASIANDAEKNPYRLVNKEVCETKYSHSNESRFSHYLVRYEYQGKRYSYTTTNHPKTDNIRVRVNIAPF